MTECSRCGDCCEAIPVDVHALRRDTRVKEYLAVPDPSDDSEWARWMETGAWTEDQRPNAVAHWYELHFIVQHWHNIGDGESTCDMFDPVSRLCTAHDQRPAVCSDYPWYGKDPVDRPIELMPRCSYWADLPEDRRPEDWQPVVLSGVRG